MPMDAYHFMTRATRMMVAPRALTALMRMCVCVQTLMEFELMVETEPVQAHMVLATLPTPQHWGAARPPGCQGHQAACTAGPAEEKGIPSTHSCLCPRWAFALLLAQQGCANFLGYLDCPIHRPCPCQGALELYWLDSCNDDVFC